MKTYKSLDELPALGEAFVTVGNFDGLHLGHRKIIGTMCSAAGQRPTVAVTFDRAPIEYLNPGAFRGYIFPPGKKERALERIGIGHLVSLDFPSVRDVSAEIFVRSLLGKIPKMSLFVGYNFRFGKGNSGSADTLRKASQEMGFELTVFDRVIRDNLVVSSSTIRDLIHLGDLEKARDLLGRPYAMSAPTEKGDGLGQKLGFPTINLSPNRQVMPRPGVYFTFYVDDRSVYPAMTYIGRRPTVSGNHGALRNETNILEFDGDWSAVGAKTEHTVFFLKRTRGEKKLRNLEELGKTLYTDRQLILDLYRTYRTGNDPQNLLSEENLCR